MILILGGTSDSIQIAEKLNQINKPYYLSVVSDYGRKLAEAVTSRVLQRAMDTQAMTKFIQQEQIELLIDATHPFATEASLNAISACQLAGIRYLRYERPSVDLSDAIVVKTNEEACNIAKNFTGCIYLTTGSKTLGEFVEKLPKNQVVARVLPVSSVLLKMETLGLLAHQIEAIKGPFSTKMNVALIEHNQAQVLITKESGQSGGLKEKIEACQEVGIPCVVIRRKQINYPEKSTTITDLLDKAMEEDK